MKLGLELFFLLILILIFFQDLRERKITLWFLLLGIISGGILNYVNQQPIVFFTNTTINISFIMIVFLILWIYAKLKMRKKIFEVFGKGDLLFFILLATSLPILSFLIVFIFSIIFSLVIFLILKNQFKDKTVPLAGFQSLFLAIVLIANKLFHTLNIYLL